MQQVTLAIRAMVPLGVLRDTIQPFPSFSEIFAAVLKVLAQDQGRDRVDRRQSVPAGSLSK